MRIFWGIATLLALPLACGSVSQAQAVGTIFFQTSVNSAPTAATPTFSPAAGTYTGSQSITISTTTSGATICYTTDGTTPTAVTPGTCTTGTTYAAPVTVSATSTVNAIATETGYQNSAVGSATYTIQASAAVQYTSCTTAAAASITCTFGTGITSGNQVLVACDGASTSTYTVTQGTSNFALSSTLDVLTGVTGGTTALTINPTDQYHAFTCIAAEMTSIAASSPVDQAGSIPSQYVSSGTTSLPAVTTVNASDMVIGLATAPASTTITPGTGFTEMGPAVTGNGMTLFMEYQLVSATGTYTPAVVYGAVNATTYNGTAALVQ